MWRFESSRESHGVLAQQVRALPGQGRGRGFESRRSRHASMAQWIRRQTTNLDMRVRLLLDARPASSMGERLSYEQETRVRFLRWLRWLSLNGRAPGCEPGRCAFKSRWPPQASVAEWAIARGCKPRST